MNKYFNIVSLLIAFIISVTSLQSMEENNIDQIFKSLADRSHIYPSEILTDLQNIDKHVTNDYEKNTLPTLMNIVGAQRAVYSISMMNSESLEKICRNSTEALHKQNIHHAKAIYLNILKENHLVNSDEFNLYNYLLSSL